MPKLVRIFLRWLPALFMMLLIFLVSARPSSQLPNFGWVDQLIKKGGHAIGYALLAFFYWRAFEFRKDKRPVVWVLTLLYAMSDEFHQSFVPGRHPSIADVLIFDNLGSLISLWLLTRYRKQKRPDSLHPIAEQTRR